MAIASLPNVPKVANGVARALGGFFAMSLDTFAALGKRPFQWRELIEQTQFIIKVTFLPAILVTVPFLGGIVFLINQLLLEIGAVDLAGGGVGIAVVKGIGPLSSILLVAGAGATAIAADLGSRKIREEIDAMEVLGIDPVHRLVLPRVIASTVVAVSLNVVIVISGVITGYAISVAQGCSPGQFFANASILVQTGDVYLGLFKDLIFGALAGLVGCYRGMTVKGGAKGVGEAVNETVVLTFVLLFIMNSVLTAASQQIGLTK